MARCGFAMVIIVDQCDCWWPMDYNDGELNADPRHTITHKARTDRTLQRDGELHPATSKEPRRTPKTYI